MKITGPFLDPDKRDQPKPWFLYFRTVVKNPDGSLKMNERGRPVMTRHRPYYKTKAAAEADKPSILAQHGAAGAQVSGGILSRDQAAEFEAAKLIVDDVPLPELARFWLVHHPRQKTERVNDFIPKLLLELKPRVSKRHYSDLNSRLPIMGRVFGERIPATITREEVMTWLATLAKPRDQGGQGLAGRTVLNFKRAAVILFNWFLEKGAVKINPIAGIKRRQLPARIETKEIEFLTVPEVRRYLAACERYDPDLVAHEVIQLFSGVRSDDEMGNFDGKWVLEVTREVVIPAEIAKMDRREVINGLEENFWAWWTAYGRKGILRPKNYEPRWKRVRALARVDDQAEADALARLPIKHLLERQDVKARLRRWPQNARRRTFCTYHVALHQSADKTALILRHRGDSYTLHNSYRGLGVTQDQGAEFFGILPAQVATPIRPELPARGAARKQLASASEMASAEG